MADPEDATQTEEVQGHRGDLSRMAVPIAFRKSANDHVGVPDRLHLRRDKIRWDKSGTWVTNGIKCWSLGLFVTSVVKIGPAIPWDNELVGDPCGHTTWLSEVQRVTDRPPWWIKWIRLKTRAKWPPFKHLFQIVYDFNTIDFF